jgi:hypothetical protein
VTSIANLNGQLAANVPLGINTQTPIITTAPLAVGTWQVNFNVEILLGATCVNPLCMVFPAATGTATATFAGPEASQGAAMGPAGTPANGIVTLSLTTIAVVTVAGTIQLYGISLDTIAQGTALQFDHFKGAAPATGYTATRLA